jgi:hydroxymethylglutaryl-CoA lyase
MRDGLQSVPVILATEEKLKIYDALVSIGIGNLQITSFVSPTRLPQLSDAEALYSALKAQAARHSVLVANMRGFERALLAGVREIEAVVSVSESYNQKNAHRSVSQSLNEIKTMVEQSRVAGVILTVGLANCYHCVFEGKISSGSVFSLLGKLVEFGVSEICLCDTTGFATPAQVYELSERSLQSFPQVEFGAHLHDTRGRGLANAMAALTAGINWFDAALAGLGGSPFAPGMGGNLSLETLVDSLAAMGIPMGIDAEKIFDLGARVNQIIQSAA